MVQSASNSSSDPTGRELEENAGLAFETLGICRWAETR